MYNLLCLFYKFQGIVSVKRIAKFLELDELDGDGPQNDCTMESMCYSLFKWWSFKKIFCELPGHAHPIGWLTRFDWYLPYLYLKYSFKNELNVLN